jgi:hypothetical protein
LISWKARLLLQSAVNLFGPDAKDGHRLTPGIGSLK